MTSGIAALRPRSVAFSGSSAAWRSVISLLVAQLVAQRVDFLLQRLARGEAFLHPAPGRGRRVHGELQWVDSGLQAVAGGVEPAAALVVEHEHDREQGVTEKTEPEGRAASAD